MKKIALFLTLGFSTLTGQSALAFQSLVYKIEIPTAPYSALILGDSDANANWIVMSPTQMGYADGSILQWAPSPTGENVAALVSPSQEPLQKELWVSPLQKNPKPIKLSHVLPNQNCQITEWAWSPSGQLIAYVITDDADVNQLYVSDLNGNSVGLANSPRPIQLNPEEAWSDDGKLLAYGEFIGARPSLHIYHPASNSTLNFGAIEADQYLMTYRWQPNSSRLAWTQLNILDHTRTLHARSYGSTSIDTYSPALPCSSCGVLPNNHSASFIWSANGQWLAFRARTDIGTHLYQSNGVEIQVANHSSVSGSLIDNFDFSPDSRYLSYGVSGDGLDSYSLYSFEEDAEQHHFYAHSIARYQWAGNSENISLLQHIENFQTRLLFSTASASSIHIASTLPADTANFAYALWASDSERLLYRANLDAPNQHELFISDIHEPSNPMQVTEELPAGVNVQWQWDWADNNSRVIYLRNNPTTNHIELHGINVNGDDPIKISPTTIDHSLVTEFRLID